MPQGGIMTYAQVRSATDQLVALVEKMRAWDQDEIRRPIAACQVTGWPFSQVALEMVRLAITDGAEPSELMKPRRVRVPKGKSQVFAVVVPAMPELVALTTQMREDWDTSAIRYTLAICHGQRWPFAQAALELVRLAVIPDSEPRDLANAAMSPFSHRTLQDRRHG
jgi:hypothetical protein